MGLNYLKQSFQGNIREVFQHLIMDLIRTNSRVCEFGYCRDELFQFEEGITCFHIVQFKISISNFIDVLRRTSMAAECIHNVLTGRIIRKGTCKGTGNVRCRCYILAINGEEMNIR